MKFTRRKALLGLGSVAAGTGAVITTGANTAIEAPRNINVDVVGDANAFLGITNTATTSFVSTDTSSALQIQLSGNAGGGSGINVASDSNHSITNIDPAFLLQNQGPDTVYVEVDNPGADTTGTTGNNDLQFIADDSGLMTDGTANDVLGSTNNPAFIDRGGTTNTTKTSIVRGTSGTGDDVSVGAAGSLAMMSGEAVAISVQAVSEAGASQSTDWVNSVTLEAYNETSNTDFATVESA